MIKTIPDAARAVTPSDTNYIADNNGNRSFGTLYIGVAGNVNVLPQAHADSNNATSTGVAGGAVLYTNVPVGFFPIQVKKVFATGTTASGIICQFDN